MKIFNRIALALTALAASLFVTTPAFAAGDVVSEFSSAGEPVQVVPILICGAIVLLIVLGTAQLLGSLFNPKSE